MVDKHTGNKAVKLWDALEYLNHEIMYVARKIAEKVVEKSGR